MLQMEFASCECVSGLMCLLMLPAGQVNLPWACPTRNCGQTGLRVPGLFPYGYPAAEERWMSLLLQIRCKCSKTGRLRQAIDCGSAQLDRSTWKFPVKSRKIPRYHRI